MLPFIDTNNTKPFFLIKTIYGPSSDGLNYFYLSNDGNILNDMGLIAQL